MFAVIYITLEPGGPCTYKYAHAYACTHYMHMNIDFLYEHVHTDATRVYRPYGGSPLGLQQPRKPARQSPHEPRLAAWAGFEAPPPAPDAKIALA